MNGRPLPNGRGSVRNRVMTLPNGRGSVRRGVVSQNDERQRVAVMCKSGEKGSALLIVFVFAAMVAIMLYMEMPVAVFEARRQKEQLLIDRGNEYKHAVKLFVRKTGMYPPSIDALENTNRIRFLRHKFKDPFTDSDDWRLLHAGPGGMLLDSKVNPIKGMGQNGTSSSSGGNSGFGSGTNNNTASSGFGSGFSSGFGSSSDNGQVVVPPLRQRSPAVSASGGAAIQQASSGSETDANGLPPLPQADQNDLGAPGSGVAASGPDQSAAGQPNQPATAGASSNPMQAVSGLLSNPNSPPPAAGPVTTGGSTMGRITTGGIAGVASKAKGHSIKTVNDQDDYSLWEFYYDPTKDAARGMAGGLPAAGAVNGNVGANAAGGFQSSTTNQNSPNPNTPAAQTVPNTPPQLMPSPGGAATPANQNPPQQ